MLPLDNMKFDVGCAVGFRMIVHPRSGKIRPPGRLDPYGHIRQDAGGNGMLPDGLVSHNPFPRILQ